MHLVFSTKHREPLIYPPVEAELHAYLGGICNKLDCTVIKVGGYIDHVHILCMKKVSSYETVGRIKITFI
jgi:putative transposase